MGVELTGYVAWDMDETLSSDVLDGEEGSRERDVVFETIATLERADARSTRVTLRSGEELLLSGTNDVNSSNRGVEVSDPSFGRAVVAWEVLESLRFHPPAAAADRRAFYDRAGPLTGIVETRAGRTHAGRIRWDNDEEFGWEMLDGRSDGVDYDIELGRVRIIEPVGSSQARVELRDGRSLLLEDSNDVDERNQGIFVLVEGAETVLVRWPGISCLFDAHRLPTGRGVFNWQVHRLAVRDWHSMGPLQLAAPSWAHLSVIVWHPMARSLSAAIANRLASYDG
jgi:hypothetical protein